MINTIKKTFTWIKEKTIKLWKVLVVAIVGAGVVAIGTQIESLPGDKIPEHLNLKAPIERVVNYKIEDGVVYYAYRSENPSKRRENEVKRTRQTITQGLGDGQFVITSFLGQKFYRETEGGDWYDVEYATTTLEVFNKQVGIGKKGILSWVKQVFAADTGWHSPAAYGRVYTQWTSPWFAETSDNSRATEDTNGEKEDWYNFGLGVPGGATIDGILVDVEGYCNHSNPTYCTLGMFLSWDGGTSWTDEEQNDMPGPAEGDEAYIPWGGSSNLWGRSWTSSEFSDANFDLYLIWREIQNVYIDHIRTKVYYTQIVVPTVTTQAASSIEDTTATGNGNITNTGGVNCHTRGICYKVGTTGDPTTSDSKVYDNGGGSYGTGAFSKGLTGLSTGTSYRVRAYAINTAGTGYGTTVQILTKPAAPTSVAATDGEHTNKVVITWVKSTGATGYKVYEGANLLDTLGDVATYDDSAAPAPTITPGDAVASDGSSSAHVALNLNGESANVGSSRTYKVVALNGTGDSDDSSTNAGYRGVGTLTYQWQRSAADSDANYAPIDGATTEAYNDTGAPANGDGRYYKCVENATGATEQTSGVNRGYRLSKRRIFKTD